MGLNAKKVKGNTGSQVQQEPIESGTYPARLVQVLDLGMQPQRPYKGEAKPPAHDIMLTYEFVDEFCLDKEGNELHDKPRWLSETMPFRSLTSDLATSTKRYRALDPNEVHDGDFTALTSAPCMVTVSNKEAANGKIYTNIVGVSAMRPKEAAKCPELVNPAKVFVLDEPDLEVLSSLPEWLQDKIKSNLEFSGSTLEQLLNGDKPKPAKLEPKAPVDEPEDDEDEFEDDGQW